MTFDEYFSSIKDKKIAVVGLGVSNRPLLDILLSFGCDVTVCDKKGDDISKYQQKGVKFSLGEAYLDNLDFDIIFRTPGILPFAFEENLKDGCVITSEMEVFFALCPCKTIAVTGSDGKTTTASLISEILKSAGYTVHLGGNIGVPLLSEVQAMAASDIAVLELSSFQLHSMKCCPDVAVVTNISPNHLDVHPDFNDYVGAKRNVFLGQTEIGRLVLNAGQEMSALFANEARAQKTFFSMRERSGVEFFFCDGAIWGNGQKIIHEAEILLPGRHNIENLLAAFAAVQGFADFETCAKVARSFGGVSHRIEFVRKCGGVSFYNDSIASSPTRAIAALKTFPQKVILIAGGHDKNVPYDDFAAEIIKGVRALFLTGEAAEKISAAVVAREDFSATELPVFRFEGFTECVKAAAEFSEDGDIVILSPACSSFDFFKNFEQRGNLFKEIVRKL